MNNDLTELVFIIDKSGSMNGLETDTIGGFNSLIEKQKKEKGDALVTTILFNQNSFILHDRACLNEVNKMKRSDYVAKGCTALLDAIGMTITRLTKKHNELKDEFIPKKTIVVIITDGMENASIEYDYESVKRLIDKQKELGWEFIFLGANIDVCKEASKFGIDKDNAVRYCCDSKGVDLNYSALADAICEVRKEGKLNKNWRCKIDNDYKKREKK